MNNLQDEFHKVIEGDTAWLLLAESGTEIALEVGGFALNVFCKFWVAQAIDEKRGRPEKRSNLILLLGMPNAFVGPYGDF